MKTFKDLKFEKHPRFENGTQARLDFKNNYGISVITGNGAYQTNGNYEVAIFKDKDICYETSITDDVLSNQSEKSINGIMKTLQNY